MEWIYEYQLFLFDFDGLLVNTEEIHFQAYKKMCKDRGFNLNWDFNRYCQSAHYDADALQKDIYKEFPELYKIEPNWTVLYAEKKKNLIDLFKGGAVHLMPGVEDLLIKLKNNGITCCVVTHSAEVLINIIREQNPILNTIQHWITREFYTNPKPHSECYLKAIEELAKETDKIIGFEDTPRGLQALLGTKAKPVMICQAEYPEIPSFKKKGVLHFPSFKELSSRANLL